MYGPAKWGRLRSAKIVVAQRWNLDVVPVVLIGIGVQHVVTEELVHISMELVRASACDDIDLSAGTSSELCVVVTALYGKLCDGIDAGIGKQRKVSTAIHIVRAIDIPSILCRAATIDSEINLVRCANRVAGADINLIGVEASGYTWH